MYYIWINILLDKLINILGSSVYSSYIKNLGLKGDESVLDFGSGSGAGSRHIAKILSKGGYLTCVDISNDWTQIAKRRMKNYNNVEYKVGDILNMDININSYDAVFIHYVLHDIPFSQRQKIIEKLVTFMKKSGKLFIREPIKESHGMPADEIIQIMKNCNLTMIKKEIDKSKFSGIFQK